MSERMSDQFHGFYVESGDTLRLMTAGKYCAKDIYVSAIGGVEDLDEVLTEQESKIAQLQAILDKKAAGSGGAAIPDGYHDVSGVTATAGDVLAGMKFVDKNGNLVDGTIPVITGERSLDRDNDSLEYEDGYYPAMLNSAYVDWEDITITPTEEQQHITKGKFHEKAFFRNIIVEPIPSGHGQENLDALLKNQLTSLNSDVTSIRQFAFRGATALTSINLPSATKINTNAFYGCTNLTTVNMPKVTNVSDNAFNTCSILPSIVLPSLTTGGGYMFRYCYKLLTVDLPVIKNIVANMFADCRAMTAVILRSPTLCTLANTSAFSNCYHFHGTTNSQYNPDGLKDGYIYVPKTLADGTDGVATYQAATNWSAFQFRAIEDYPSITGG